MCKVYTGYCGTSEIEHDLCACTVDNPLAKARGLSLRTGAQPMLYLLLEKNSHKILKESLWRHCRLLVYLLDSENILIAYFNIYLFWRLQNDILITVLHLEQEMGDLVPFCLHQV